MMNWTAGIRQLRNLLKNWAASGQTMRITQPDFGRRLENERETKRLKPGVAAERHGGEHVDYVTPGAARDHLKRRLFQSTAAQCSREVDDALCKSLRLYLQLASLVGFLGGDARPMPRRVGVPKPHDPAEAVRQGREAAKSERERLAISLDPIADIWALIESQGIDVGLVELPAGLSGLMLAQSDMRPFIIVNANEHVIRRSFSLAHEFAHVLFDRDEHATVSHQDEATSLLEVRANAFASEFLLPAGAVKRYLIAAGKFKPRFIGRPYRGEIAAEDVIALAGAFRVSRSVVLVQLQRLKFVRSAAERDKLLSQTETLHKEPVFDHAGARVRFQTRYVDLALEARRAGCISRGKLAEVLGLVMDRSAAGSIANATMSDI